MKRIIITIDDVTISMMDECIKKLNATPKEGGAWNRSKFIRVGIYDAWKKIIPIKKEKGF